MSIQNSGLTRRKFLQQIALGMGTIATGISLSACDDNDDNNSTNTESTIPTEPHTFTHGVASGDPLQDRVILWTRVTHPSATPINTQWEIALDAAFTQVINQGTYTTSAEEDFTVKVDADQLNADTHYYYRFKAGNDVSLIGQTQTLPNDTQFAKLAVVSCSNYPAGYFNVYAEINKHNDINAVVHLGDYIYEYDQNGYASADSVNLNRVSQPTHEITQLGDYRIRYAQYRSDIDLQNLHQNKAFICVWDDHEIANDAYRTGAENHSEGTEGTFTDRKAAALRAYYEWLPVREPDLNALDKIYRRFDFGQLCSLYMLDTRLIGRDQQLDYANYMDSSTGFFDAERFQAELTNPNRQLLGVEQTTWLQTQLATSTATWQVLGQQILMGRMNVPAPLVTFQISFSDYNNLLIKAQTAPETLSEQEQSILAQAAIPYNLDAWDGYFVARETVLATAKNLDKNLVVLSGDTHNAWANNLSDFEQHAIGVEFATASVSSPGLEAIFADQDPDTLAAGLTQLIDGLQFSNTQHRGFMLVSFTPTEANAEWIFIDTVKSKHYQVLEAYGKRLKTLAGTNNRQLVEA